jgi:adenosine deaminase
VRIVDDLQFVSGGVGTSGFQGNSEDVAYAAHADPSDVTLGGLAGYVRDRRIPLEMCPSSNVQTGAAESVALHPISLLKRLRFRVTVNTDNRLMSGTSMTREMSLLVNEAGWDLGDLRWATINAMKSAFIPFDERLAIIDDVVKPGYAALGQT